MDQGEIILYQPDEAIQLEVRLEKETVWLTQIHIAELLKVKQPALFLPHFYLINNYSFI